MLHSCRGNSRPRRVCARTHSALNSSQTSPQTDRVDAPILAAFHEAASEFANADPATVTPVTGYDTIAGKVVLEEVRCTAHVPDALLPECLGRLRQSVRIEEVGYDGPTFAADAVANCLADHLRSRPPSMFSAPLRARLPVGRAAHERRGLRASAPIHLTATHAAGTASVAS